MEHQEEKLRISSPQFRLRQGYSITYDGGGKIIKEAGKLQISQDIVTKFYKGRAISKLKEIER